MRQNSRQPLACLLGALALWAAVGVAVVFIRAGDGLSARYFRNTSWSGPAALTAADREVSDGTMTRRWKVVPDAFSVRWVGYLAVGEAGNYSFALTSDDGAVLWVDGRPVVDNGGIHSATTKTGAVNLARGRHLVVIDYSQSGGGYTFGWAWSRDGVRFEPVPWWALSPRPVGEAEVLAARVLDWLAWILASVVVGCAAWAIRAWRPTGRGRRRPPRAQQAACLALFVSLAVIQTWPLATDPAHLSRNDNSDTVLNEWIIAWVVHQAPRDPAHLFDANIFHPERNTLALSEALLVQSAMAAPVIWAGASPVLAYNLVLIAGFALTGFAMCLLVARWTDDWAAGIVAGILTAFSAHLLTRMPHLQALHVEFLPFALLALDRLLRAPRARHAVSLAAWFTLQALASYYLFVITTVGLAAAALARPGDWWGAKARRVAGHLAIASGLAALALLPYLVPYWRATQELGIVRSIDDMLPAVWQDYLMTPARLDYQLLARFWAGTALFPGFIGLLLAAAAIARGALKDPNARMCAAFGICGVALSFGAAVPGFSTLYAAFPPLHGIRAVSRFGFLGTVAVAILGGFGVATIARPGRRPALAGAAVVALTSLVTLETLAAPIRYAYFPGIPGIYDRLDGRAHAVVAELPLAAYDDVFANASAMLHSTTSFYRLVNGFSGFTPRSYVEHRARLAGFPDAGSIDVLRRVGVTHVFVHIDRYDAGQLTQLREAPGLRLLAGEGDVELFEVLGLPR